MKRLSLGTLLLCWLLAVLASSSQPVTKGLTVETLLKSGPNTDKIDLVFCGDGYTKAQRNELKGIVNGLLSEFWAISPYRELKSEFNVYLVYLDSPTGDRSEGRLAGQFLLGSHKPDPNSDLVILQHPQVVDAVAANAPACDLSVVVTRMEGRSHSGRHVVVSQKAKLVLAHELGHRLAELGDEYTSASLLSDRDSHPLPRNGQDLPAVNLTLSAFIDPSTPATIKKTAKWKHFLELPDGDVVSAYQGGYYRVVDVWRPFSQCVMSNGQYPYFCPVCHEHLYAAILKKNHRPFNDDKYHRDFPLKLWKGGLRR